MATEKMHVDEENIDTALAQRLLAQQFPGLANLPIVPLLSSGTVNAVFRLGDGFCLRFPRLADWAKDLEKELAWLPLFAGQVSLTIPEPVAQGKPGFGYPFTWAVYRWLEGEPLIPDHLGDERQAAERLAKFVGEFRQVDPTSAPRSSRDRPLQLRDDETRKAIEASEGLIDTGATTAVWELSLQAPEWDQQPVWTHGDLLTPNLLMRQGRLSGVLDFGNMGVGDPAVDIIPAWTVFGPAGRRAFRAALAVDDGTWARSRGFALHQAALIIPYYQTTNPAFSATAVRTIEAILADIQAGG